MYTCCIVNICACDVYKTIYTCIQQERYSRIKLDKYKMYINKAIYVFVVVYVHFDVRT